MKSLNQLILVLALATGCLWLFGSRQPIVDVAQAAAARPDGRVSCPGCAGTGQVKCPECAGFGKVDADSTCPACKGTGKGDWSFGSPDRQRLSSARPPCMKCSGTGRATVRQACSTCNGLGHATCSGCSGTGIANPDRSPAHGPRTARAELSLWEKSLALLRIKPDLNAAPQSRGGRVPLVERYVQLRSGPRAYEVVAYRPTRHIGRQWYVPATLREKGQDRVEAMVFIIENRTVLGSRPDD